MLSPESLTPATQRSLANFLLPITTNIFDSALEKQRRKVCELLLNSVQSVVCFPRAELRSISCSTTAPRLFGLLINPWLAKTEVEIVELQAQRFEAESKL